MRKPISQRTKKNNLKAFDAHFKANQAISMYESIIKDREAGRHDLKPCGCDPQSDELCGECNTETPKKMANILIKNKDYPLVEIDNSEKDVIQFIGVGKTETDIVFIERDKIKELIETLTYIEAGEC